MTEYGPLPQRVLVTGSSGFIGQWLCNRLLADGVTVLGLDMRPAPTGAPWQHQTVDMLDAAALLSCISGFAPDAIVHLAARTDLEGRSLEEYEVNRGGVRNLCDAVRATPSVKRVIYTSSQLVCRVGHVPTADDEYLPSTIYGESKIATEKVVRALDGGGATWCLTRPTTVWGPGMSPHYLTVLRLIDRGLFFHSGSGALMKSYAYAENITHQYVQVLRADRDRIHRKVFYFADYEPFSLRAYINALADHMGRRRPPTLPLPAARLLGWAGDGLARLGIRFPFTSFRLNNIRTEYVFDLTPTRDVCGPLPISFDDGVRRTVEWYRHIRRQS
jgi:GlcNAc-P-P-Und epimerase